jgi:hypothetical protein
MKFNKGNKIKCSQDHGVIWYKEIPCGVEWVVEKDMFGNFTLSAYGYGQLKPRDDKSYGNGSLFPFSLTDKQKQLLEDAALKQKESAPISTNTGSLQLLCDIKELLLNHDTPSKESRTIIIARINESIAQQQAGA